MKNTPHSLQRHTRTIAWSISLTIAILAPSAYYLTSYQYMRGVMETRTELRALDVSRIIHANPVMWRFEEVRLSELLERRSTDDVEEMIRITDATGDLVAKNDMITAPPRTRHIHNVYDAGSIAAHIEVSRSLRPLLFMTLMVAVGSTAVAFILFLALRTLPQKALQKTFQALSESENKYRSLYETMKEGMALHLLTRDVDGIRSSLSLIDANPSCIAMLGGDRHKIIGSDSLALFGEAFRRHFPELVQVAEHKGYASFELTMPGDLHYNVHAFSPEQGHVATLFENITDRRKAERERLDMERQLLHAQKLESLGILSGGIAHDFNNLLHALLGNLDLALRKLPGNSDARRNIDEALVAGKQAAKLTNMMLAYSGKGIIVAREMDLTSLVETNASLLAASIPKSITLNLAMDHDLPPMVGDEGQLQQVVMNLFTNAAEAFGDGHGSIWCTTGVDEFDQATLDTSRVEEKLVAGRYVFLEVRDNGCGMNDETLHRLFDPFFTTKFTGRGLGLSAVLGIIRAHKGAFLVKSQPGVGTTIRVLFPIVEPSVKRQPDSAPLPADTAVADDQQLATILIVDDEEMVRHVAVAMLGELGFKTMAAADGEEALRILHEHGNGIEVVLLDQNMPRMDGVTVFKKMRTLRPDIKVLLASGYSEVEISERFDALGLDGIIQKPFDLKHLADRLRRVMQG